MALANLRNELKRKSDLEAAKLSEAEKEEIAKIREEAKGQIRKIMDEAREDAKTISEKERMRISAANLTAKRIVQDAKYELVKKVLEELGKEIGKEAKGQEYEKLLEKLIKEAKKGIDGECVLHVREKDFATAKKFGEVAKKPIETSGGVKAVSADGRITIDNTFEALLDEKKEMLAQKAFEILFVK